jgi:hypothetical protein
MRGSGIPILPGDRIQSSVVLDEAKLSIFLLDEEDRSSEGGLGLPDASSGQCFFQESVHLCLLCQGHWIDLAESG